MSAFPKKAKGTLRGHRLGKGPSITIISGHKGKTRSAHIRLNQSKHAPTTQGIFQNDMPGSLSAVDPTDSSRMAGEPEPYACDDAGPWDSVDTPEAGTQSKKTKSQNDFLNEWLSRKPSYLNVLLDFEAIGQQYTCASCNVMTAELFRCRTCLGSADYCQLCLVRRHQSMPFHRIAAWNQDSGCFLSTSLAQLGLVLDLEHATHDSDCPRSPSLASVTAVHTNGIHDVTIRFSLCCGSPSLDLQLLANCLFPSTVTSPESAFSFELLEQFHYHHLEGKWSAYSFMNAISRLTNDTGNRKVEDRVREFRRVYRQWSHLVNTRDYGQFGSNSLPLPPTNFCPACPQPGKNIPIDWRQNLPEAKHWLHRQFIHFDANFKLTLDKRTDRAGGSISLWEGSGFFVDSARYQQYLSQVMVPNRENTECVDHKAVLHVSKSRFNSLEVSGVAGAVCRHECAIPQSFVNLTHGERYVNSDYGVSSAFQWTNGLKEIVFSYDIACQYSRRFLERFNASPALELPNCLVVWAIPKFHLPVHREACRIFYSFNHMKRVGRTDGEAIERFWSRHNHLSGSTTRMTPESRLDTLDSHFADWNWRKTVGMGVFLKIRLKEACEQVTAHQERFDDLCSTLSEDDAVAWTTLEDEYIPEFGTRTIYQLATEEAPSQATILRELSQQRDPANARPQIPGENVPAIALWLNDGLELEDAQRSLRVFARTINAGSTDRDRNILNHRRMTLYQRVAHWKQRSPLEYDEEHGVEEDEAAADIEHSELPLPSNLALNRDIAIHILRTEKDLRTGQAYDALKYLRKALALRLALVRENRHMHGNRDNLRSRAAVKQAEKDIDAITIRYRSAYSALEKLGLGEEQRELQPLDDADVSTANVFHVDRPLGRGFDVEDVSWIWRVRHNNAEAEDSNWLLEVLRVQFLDVKTTLNRWQEEVEMLQMELTRTRDYFHWMGSVWRRRAELSMLPGERAHAYSMVVRFEGLGARIPVQVA